ncbi:hypothetical protein [Riemerella columbina]|uniref:hypothetical protein n=1 Tax=Riemerella columbina TaxID=103810 RepID=UPI00266FF45F|nr:hypothetical protein [Riemerella columbina]WKS95935.1 hypothetical protein NYR17_04160 [Riemerella columbina]
MPSIDLTNKAPLQTALGTNEVFMAGDFPVTVLSAQGSNGIYSGEGYIQVPYLGDAKIKVVFNNIKLNTDKQLISGVVETTYDANESAISFVSEGIGELFGDEGVKDITLNYTIKGIKYDEKTKRIIIIGDAGAGNESDRGSGEDSQDVLPGGKDYTLTDAKGNVWAVDEEGKVTCKSGNDRSNDLENIKNIFGSSGGINKNIKFIYEEDKYQNGAMINAMLDGEDLNISVKTAESDTISLKGDLVWIFDKKEIAKGKNLVNVVIQNKDLSNKTYKLEIKKEGKKIANLKINFYKIPVLSFSLPNDYDQSFLFDDEFIKNSNVRKNYELLSSIKDYHIPVVAVGKDKIAKLKMKIKGLPDEVKNNSNFKIELEMENRREGVEITNAVIDKTNINNSFLEVKPLSTMNDNDPPMYINAKFKNKVIGKVKLYCYPVEEKKLQLIYVKWGKDNYRNVSDNQIFNFLKTKSMNQLFFNFIDKPTYKMDLSKNEKLGKQLDSLLTNYKNTSKEGAELLTLLKQEYQKENTIIDGEDYFFIINRSVTLPDGGELGGFHYTGNEGGVLFKYKDPADDATAHEMGHWLGLEHTWKEGTPIKIPQSQTQNNFMDYNIKRKSWFEYQMKKAIKNHKNKEKHNEKKN